MARRSRRTTSRTNHGSCNWASARASNHDDHGDELNHEAHEGHEVKKILYFVHFVTFVVILSLWSWPIAAQAPGRINIPYADAKPILDTLKPDLLPAQLRTLTPSQRE